MGILCCGSIVADIVVQPVSQLSWGKTTWIDSIQLNLGGNGASTSFTLGKLGIPVRLIGAVGTDQFGRDLLGELQSVGVDVTYIERLEHLPTAVSIALVHPDGSRALLQQPGASRDAYAAGFEFKSQFVDGCSHLHLANIFALKQFQHHAHKILSSARDRGWRTSIDTGWDPQERWMDTLQPCLPYIETLFVNLDEATHLTGTHDPMAAADFLVGCGPGQVVVKLGSNGCLVVTRTGRFSSPAFPVKALDSTGAGDCFVAGFLAALKRGFDLREAARFANAVGALSVQRLGAVTGIADFEATLEWMRQAS
jgi:sugar/nucleoside kinase (ribokinase family)